VGRTALAAWDGAGGGPWARAFAPAAALMHIRNRRKGRRRRRKKRRRR
jgi:hypothetical protein